MNCNNNILNFSNEEAKEFFLKNKSYCNIDLPCYFNFEKILKKTDEFIKNENINDFFNSECKPCNLENVNHKFLKNKNGSYSWRQLQIIHPVLYVALVNIITDENNWQLIQQKFIEFRENKNISCVSIPIESKNKENDKAKSVICWWNEVEQKSVELSLEYQYLIETDIVNCYDSIYTHSIPWALHGKPNSKQNPKDNNLFGNIIDLHIRNMSYGQTNGIPQGSVIMDFIAEIVLGYIDKLLSEKIQNYTITGYHIIRYRDDYRIFSNNLSEGKKILKILSEILSDQGMRLNSNKTNMSNELIQSSIKSDKLYWICNKNKSTNLQKNLLIIHSLANKYPNSGSLNKALNEFFQYIKNKSTFGNINIPVLISIITDIALKNPRIYPIYSAIISKFLSLLKEDSQKIELVNKIINKFKLVPNIGYLEIWLQRITSELNRDLKYKEGLCKVISKRTESIWNSDWLSSKELIKILKDSKIFDEEIIEKMPSVIEEEEINFFIINQY